MIVELDNRHISGPLDENTPLVVLVEVAGSLGVEYNKDFLFLTRCLKTIVPYTIDSDKEFSKEDLRDIARFVNYNKDVIWNKNSLMLAFDHMMTFYDKEKIELPPKDFVIGSKTTENPYSYNASMLYKLCKQMGIKTYRSTSLERMGEIVKSVYTDIEKIRSDLFEVLFGMDKYQLLSLSLSFPSKQKTSLSLDQTLANFQNREYVLSRIYPQSDNEAITMAALIYRIDISESKYPSEEYVNMGIHGWLPLDDSFKNRYMKNPDWYNVDITWRPMLRNMYNNEVVKDFAIKEGFSASQILRNSSESLLYESRLTSNIYSGNHPDCKDDSCSITGESFDSLRPRDIITYGIIGDNMKAYSIEGLLEFFTRYGDFLNPLNIKEEIKSSSIQKLINIIKRYGTRTLEKKVLDVIERKRSFSEYGRKLNIIFRTSEDNSIYITNYLQKLLELGYYMRGWKVNSNNELPLNRSNTQFPANLQFEVDKNVCLALNEYETSLEIMPKNLRDFILGLPLMTTHDSSGKITFGPQLDPDMGLTIHDRIKIIKDPENIHSCIRMGSNKLLASGYYYSLSCGIACPFDIKDVHEIS